MSAQSLIYNKKHVVFMVITNHSVNLDERIQKETKSLSALGCTCEIIATEYSNNAYSGFTNSGVAFRTLSLLSRRLFPRTKFLALKAMELHIRLILAVFLKKQDCLWVVDHHCAGMIIYGWFCSFFRPKLIIVWDQHELGPERHLSRRWYQWLIGRCHWVIHANQARCHALQASSNHGLHDRMLVIENFPGSSDMDTKSLPAPEEFENWLSGDAYCLFQGGAYGHRAIFECVEAIMVSPTFKMLVLGPMPDNVASEIEHRWPEYRHKIWVTGWVDPSEFDRYIEKALLSLVFYESIDLNHWLCAPNRFYHALLRGVPVVCGPNPPMKKVIDEDKVGVSCPSKTANSIEIIESIKTISANPDGFRSAVKKSRQKFTWESQNAVFNRIVDSM